MKYVPIIGLEIHAELKTKTGMFCGCKNDPDEKHPNVNVCPVCLGLPGALPVPNKKAIEMVLKVGMALKGEIPMISKFDRKNYFYPDLPKGYQISQYDLPFVFGGMLKNVRLRRVHLEEDSGRLLHSSSLADQDQRGLYAEERGSKDGQRESASRQRVSASFVDFNRSGLPLMELVTEPDIKTSDQAVEFAKELQLILRYLDVSNADMDKGQMRVEANVSLGTIVDGELKLGTKVEVKNINSFKAVKDAIEYEIKRQQEVLDDGGAMKQETRGWDDVKRITVSQRAKEDAHDYRYFPEPDIPPLDLSKFDFGALKREIPELPHEKRARFVREFGISPEQVEVLIFDPAMADFFEAAASELAAEDNENLPRERELLVNYLTSDLRGVMAEQGIGFDTLKVTPENFADLIELISHS
ncbi:MAG: Asp-tRNA(Asn)/Glu-tRNA(Gln) amidotransferase subunit GatB, partial [Patescibacteria group bacterium]